MDGSFEIIIPHGADLSRFDFKVPMFDWQGTDYPQGPPESKFGRNFELKIVEDGYDFGYILKDLPYGFKKTKWLPIEILGDGLDIFISSLNGFAKEEAGYGLKDLIVALLQNEINWVVVYSYQYDGFNKIVNGGIEDVLPNFEHALKESKGILIYK